MCAAGTCIPLANSVVLVVICRLLAKRLKALTVSVGTEIANHPA